MQTLKMNLYSDLILVYFVLNDAFYVLPGKFIDYINLELERNQLQLFAQYTLSSFLNYFLYLRLILHQSSNELGKNVPAAKLLRT